MFSLLQSIHLWLQVQSEAGFLYDSSINEHWTKDGMWPTSKDGGNRLWPYTFDNGIPQVGATDIPLQVQPRRQRSACLAITALQAAG